jgi:hypothetical protein
MARLVARPHRLGRPPAGRPPSHRAKCDRAAPPGRSRRSEAGPWWAPARPGSCRSSPQLLPLVITLLRPLIEAMATRRPDPDAEERQHQPVHHPGRAPRPHGTPPGRRASGPRPVRPDGRPSSSPAPGGPWSRRAPRRARAGAAGGPPGASSPASPASASASWRTHERRTEPRPVTRVGQVRDPRKHASETGGFEWDKGGTGRHGIRTLHGQARQRRGVRQLPRAVSPWSSRSGRAGHPRLRPGRRRPGRGRDPGGSDRGRGPYGEPEDELVIDVPAEQFPQGSASPGVGQQIQVQVAPGQNHVARITAVGRTPSAST